MPIADISEDVLAELLNVGIATGILDIVPEDTDTKFFDVGLLPALLMNSEGPRLSSIRVHLPTDDAISEDFRTKLLNVGVIPQLFDRLGPGGNNPQGSVYNISSLAQYG